MHPMHRINTECAANRSRRGRLLAVALAPALLLSLSDHPQAGAAAIAASSCGAGDRVATRKIDRLLWWHFAQAGWSAPWHVLPGEKQGSGNGC